ncbi:MAG: NAD(P)-dependent oxidoreductase [Deinococcales bacterium]
MKIFLTGGTGFIGSHIAEALLAQGYGLRLSIRPSSNKAYLNYKFIDWRYVDLSKPQPIESDLLKDISVVIHNAGITRAKESESFFLVNEKASLNLAEAAVKAGVEQFIFISSLAARGPDQRQSLGDMPSSDYGSSKLSAEKALIDFCQGTGMKLSILRLAGVYGPRDRDLLSLFQMANQGFLALPPKQGRLQPLYVSDAVAAVLAAINHKASSGPWLIAESKNYTWQEVGLLMEQALGKKLKRLHLNSSVFTFVAFLSGLWGKLSGQEVKLDMRRADDLSRYTFTGSVLDSEAALNWHAQIALSEGLKLTAEWYQKQGWL